MKFPLGWQGESLLHICRRMALGKWAAGSKTDAQEQHFGEMFCEILFSFLTA